MLKKSFTISVVIMTMVWAMGLAAVLPTASAAEAGDLIKMDGLSSVYYLGSDDGTLKRYPFPNASTFYTWYDDFSSVVTVTQDELESYPLSGVNVAYQPGDYMVKITTDPKVYAISANATLLWVSSEEVAEELYGEDWASMVHDVPDVFFGDYTLGESGTEITDAADYDAEAETAAAESISVELALDEIEEEEEEDTGDLTVSLASDTPASTAVPQGAANVVFTKVNVTAGADDVVITGFKATKYGLGANSNISNVKLFDGTAQLGNSQSLNSNNQAVFSGFSLTVDGGTTKTLDIAVTLASTVTAGHLISMGVNAAADITTVATVSGGFPLDGAEMTMSTVSIGTLTIQTGSLHADIGNVEPDATDFRFTQIKMTTATEAATVTQITAYKNGTAAAADVYDMKLVNDSTGEVLSTVAALDSSGRAIFSGLSVDIAKGTSLSFSVLASLNGGSGRTIGFDLSDGASFTIMAQGKTYGFGITPSASGSGCFAAATTACPLQTILQGKLQVNKSASTPATGFLAQGASDQAIAAWDFVVTGEAIQISALTFALSFADTDDFDYSEFTNVTLYDSDGVVVAGPLDTSSSNTLAYTDSITLPVGTNTLELRGNVSTAATTDADTDSTNGSVTATINTPQSQITAKGVDSGKTLTSSEILTSSAVPCNTMTIQAGALTVNTAATPVADSVVVNAQDYEFAHFNMNATAGGEDIRVTQIVVTDTMDGATAAYTDLANLEIWGDPDNTDDDDTLQMLDTSTSTATLTSVTANTTATATFTFSTALRISKAEVSKLILKADVVSGTALGTHAFSVAAAGNVSATGWSTGNSVTATVAGSGQAQTVRTVGLLKVEKSSDRPDAYQLVSASTGNEVMKYKVTALYEDIAITQVPLYLNSANVSNVSNVKLYLDDVQIGPTGGMQFGPDSKAVTFVLDAGEFVVEKGTANYKVLSVKVDLGTRDEVTSTNTVQVGIADSSGDHSEWIADTSDYCAAGSYTIVATGVASGTTITPANITSSGAAGGDACGSFAHTGHKGVLTVSLSSDTPSGIDVGGNYKEVLRLDLTATGDVITIFDMEFTVSGSADVTGTTACYLRKVVGGRVETVTYATWASGTSWFDPQRALTDFNVSVDAVGFDLAPEIAAGTTLTVALMGDTSNAGTSNKTIQINLQEAPSTSTPGTTAGLEWYDSSTTNVDSAMTKNLPITGGTIYF